MYRAIGAAALGFLAGVVLAVTMAVIAPTVAAGDPEPCSAEIEHAYETMRFARYTHTYWVDEIQAGHADVGTDGFGADWHSWWSDAYADVLEALSSSGCELQADHPVLEELPGDWAQYGYPSR